MADGSPPAPPEVLYLRRRPAGVPAIACDERAVPGSFGGEAGAAGDPFLAYLAMDFPMPARGSLRLPGRPTFPERLAPVPAPESSPYRYRYRSASGRTADLAAALALMPDALRRAGR
jgi:hypothetical protein